MRGPNRQFIGADFSRTVWGLIVQSASCRVVAVAATISRAMVTKWLLAFQITFMRVFDAETAQPITPGGVIGVGQLLVGL